MNREHLENLIRKLDSMSDDEFVQLLQDAGMDVEDMPEDADPNCVIIEVDV